jgi:hypothetical protein
MSVPGEAQKKYTHVVYYNMLSRLTKGRLLILLAVIISIIVLIIIASGKCAHKDIKNHQHFIFEEIHRIK